MFLAIESTGIRTMSIVTTTLFFLSMTFNKPEQTKVDYPMTRVLLMEPVIQETKVGTLIQQLDQYDVVGIVNAEM